MSKNNTRTKAIFSGKTLECLLAAGWTPHRRISVDNYEAAFAEEQVELPSKVRSFLRHFGGLIIAFKNRANRDDTLDFLADEAVQGLGHGALRIYEDIIGAGHLSPIGYYGCGACLLLMTDLGKVYSGVDFTIYFVGSSGTSAIDSIISGKELEKVHCSSAIHERTT